MQECEAIKTKTCSRLLGLDPWRLFYQQSLEIQAVRKNIVANIVTPHTQVIQSHWIFALQCKLHCLQMCVHTNIHTYIKPKKQKKTITQKVC